jgi:hypothetical protein
MRRGAFWSAFLLAAILNQGSAAPRLKLQTDSWSVPIDITEGVSQNWRAFGTAVCDPYQNLHIFWLDNGDEDSAIYYRNDLGDEWSPPRDIIVAPDYLNYDLIAMTANDSLHLAWRGSAGGLYYTGSPIATAADPLSWSRSQLLDTSVFNPALAAGPDGTLHLMYGSSGADELEYDLVYRSSVDNGVTWTDPRSVLTFTFPQAAYIRTEMAIDSANRIHVGLTLRSQAYGRFSEVGYLRSDDGGRRWEPYRRIDGRDETTPGMEWIAPFVLGEDEIHLTWHNPRRMHQWSEDGGTTWSTPVVITELGAAFGGANDLARDAAGTIYGVTAWSDGVYASRWLGSNWSIPVPIELREIDPHGQQITVCQGNVLHVLYYDRMGDTTVWYSSWTTTAPHLYRLPLPAVPTPTPQSAALLRESTPTAELQPTSTTQPSPRVSQDRIVPAASPVTPILAGALSVLGLLAAVVVIRLKKAGR